MPSLDSDNLIGLYICAGIYFVLLGLAAYWARRRLRFHAEDNHQQESDQCNKDNMIEAHYLGNRSFGTLLTAGSLFASFFSGYTVVGIPTEAFFDGWISFRWVTATIFLVVCMVGTGARFRKLGVLRNHQSPVDLITDRFQSHVLRYTIVFIMIFPSLIYLTAQMVAIRTTFNGLFNLDPDAVAPVVMIASLIVVLEWLGGLSSVALTDCIQGFTMVLVSIALPIIIAKNYLGWKDLDWETYPRQDFYQTPSTSEQWLFWNFSVIMAGAFIEPHLIQRIYAAENFRALKHGYIALSFGPWLTMFAGVFMGTVAVYILQDDPNASEAPFSSLLKAILDLGGFPYIVGVIASTGLLAAIMSTADSVLIAISQLLTTEIVSPLVPNASPTVLAYVGRSASLVSIIIALVLSMVADQGISQLVILQGGFELAAVPSFIIALFGTTGKFDCHPWILALGAIVGMISSASIHFTYGSRGMEFQSVPINSGVCAFALNIALITVLEALRRLWNRYSTQRKRNNAVASVEFSSAPPITTNVEEKIHHHWDRPNLERFGKAPLTPEYIWDQMKGIREPIVEHWFLLLALVLSILATPITESSVPPLDSNGNLLYAPNVISGIPSWAFKIIVIMIPITFILLASIYVIPDDLFLNDTIMKESIDDDNDGDNEEEEEKMIDEQDKGEGDLQLLENHN